MTESRLTKRFRLVWDADTKRIILKGSSVVYTRHPAFEADTEAEINAKVKELGLKQPVQIEEIQMLEGV